MARVSWAIGKGYTEFDKTTEPVEYRLETPPVSFPEGERRSLTRAYQDRRLRAMDRRRQVREQHSTVLTAVQVMRAAPGFKRRAEERAPHLQDALTQAQNNAREVLLQDYGFRVGADTPKSPGGSGPRRTLEEATVENAGKAARYTRKEAPGDPEGGRGEGKSLLKTLEDSRRSLRTNAADDPKAFDKPLNTLTDALRRLRVLASEETLTGTDGRVIPVDRIVVHTIRDGEGNFLGHASHREEDWGPREEFYGRFRERDSFRHYTREGGHEVPDGTDSREQSPWAGQEHPPPYFFDAHGGEGGVLLHVEGEDSPLEVDGAQLAKFLAVLRPETSGPVVLVACHTGATARGGTSVLRQAASAAPGTTWYAPTGYVGHTVTEDSGVLALLTDTDGTRTQWATAHQEPDTTTPPGPAPGAGFLGNAAEPALVLDYGMSDEQRKEHYKDFISTLRRKALEAVGADLSEEIPRLRTHAGNDIIRVPVRMKEEEHGVRLLLRARDLYVIGWENETGSITLLKDEELPQGFTTTTTPSATRFTGSYLGLGANDKEARATNFTLGGVQQKIRDLVDDGATENDKKKAVLGFVQAVSEAARFPFIEAAFAQRFSRHESFIGDTSGIVTAIGHYANSWSELTKAYERLKANPEGSVEVEIPVTKEGLWKIERRKLSMEKFKKALAVAKAPEQ